MGDANGVEIATLVLMVINILIWASLIVGAAVFVPPLIKQLQDKVDKADNKTDTATTDTTAAADQLP